VVSPHSVLCFRAVVARTNWRGRLTNPPHILRIRENATPRSIFITASEGMVHNRCGSRQTEAGTVRAGTRLTDFVENSPGRNKPGLSQPKESVHESRLRKFYMNAALTASRP
jgi:hypothetical protein